MAWYSKLRSLFGQPPVHEAAGRGRRSLAWMPGNPGAVAAMLATNAELRIKSRDLVRRNAWAQAGIGGLLQQSTSDLPDRSHQFIDRAVLDRLVGKGHPPFALGERGLQRLELGFCVGHQRYTTRLISEESENDAELVAQLMSTYCVVFWSEVDRTMAMRCVPLLVLLRASADQQ